MTKLTREFYTLFYHRTPTDFRDQHVLAGEGLTELEVDGCHHAQSNQDADRDRGLRNHQYRVLRFWNSDVLQNIDGVLEMIATSLNTNTPHPNRPAPSAGRSTCSRKPGEYKSMTRSALPGLAIATAVLVLGLLLAFTVGRYPVSLADLASVLFAKATGAQPHVSAAVQSVILEVRGPRVLAAVLVGAALAVAGTAFQGLFRNPLVSPDILGAARARRSAPCSAFSSRSASSPSRHWPLPAG